MFIQHSSQEDRLQSISRCPNWSASLSPCSTALFCQAVPARQKETKARLEETRTGKTCVLVGLKSSFCCVVSSALLNAASNSWLQGSKTLGHGLLRVTVESEGRGSSYSTPVRCRFSSLTQKFENRLYSFSAFIGNLSSWGMGNICAQQLLSLYMLSQKGLQFLERLALIYSMSKRIETSFSSFFFSFFTLVLWGGRGGSRESETQPCTWDTTSILSSLSSAWK